MKFLKVRFFLPLLLCFFSMLIADQAKAQCPPNIDFEEGTFNGWQCYNGTYPNGVLNILPTFPIPGVHTMLSSNPGDGTDPYGLFPVNCPNGSGHSIKLGDNSAGGKARAVSYTFTIPATQTEFSLIYNYAIVLNDGGHPAYLQPKMVITVDNITDGTPLPCPLGDIVVSTAGLPGFFLSGTKGPQNSPVWCKGWSAASINLNNLAGKTIKLTFLVTDCGNTAHFGYAYVDVSTECGSSFVGATFCHDDAFINVTAPYGYDAYSWYDDVALTHQIGNLQTINFTPPPPPGTLIYVKMDPYPGYGCSNVLTAKLLDTLTIQANAGPDKVACNGASVQIGANSKATYVYSWDPVTGLSDPAISNPIATPAVTTKYVLTVSHEGGGCVSTDTVLVEATSFDKTLKLTGAATFCEGTGQTAVLEAGTADLTQWYRNGVLIPGATANTYNVTQTGSYYAELKSTNGCSKNTDPMVITINPKPNPGIQANKALTQCFFNNISDFTNKTTVAAGNLQYAWTLGDGSPVETTANVTHTYTAPDTYKVRMIATSDAGCVDSAFATVVINPSPDTALAMTGNTTICDTQEPYVTLKVPATNSIQWHRNNVPIPGETQPEITVKQTGTYYAVLTNNFSCSDTTTPHLFTVNPTPVAGFGINKTIQCSNNNQFIFTNNTGVISSNVAYTWDLGDGSAETTTDVTHVYPRPGNYTIKLTATSEFGCTTDFSLPITVLPAPVPDFTIQPACINLPVLLFNKTVNNLDTYFYYLWDFDNGYTTTERGPVYAYPQPGTYNVKLYASTALCAPIMSEHTVVITAPEPGIRYADQEAIFNFRLSLQARRIGATYTWNPPKNLDNPKTDDPVFQGIDPQLYTIKIRTAVGCETVDTQYVTTRRKIQVYVPTAFTPNNDGVNDHLYPGLMGYTKMNYFKVYDRWGKLLFETTTDRPGWDGRVNGQMAGPQTVVWMIEAVDVDGKVHREQGTTILLR